MVALGKIKGLHFELGRSAWIWGTVLPVETQCIRGGPGHEHVLTVNHELFAEFIGESRFHSRIGRPGNRFRKALDGF